MTITAHVHPHLARTKLDLARYTPRTSAATWLAVTAACLLLWTVARTLFFVGLAGSDDLYYLRFAAYWHRVPANHWEARLLGNALIAAAMRLFGRCEFAGVLPSLAASIALLGSVLYTCRRLATWRHALAAGTLLAVLPIDVELATSVTPYTVMMGFMAVGTAAFITAPDTAAARITAALTLALGVVTHYSGVYYVAALAAAALVVDRRRYFAVVGLTLAAGVATLAAELLVFHLLYHDAFIRLRINQATNHLAIPNGPLTADNTFNPVFFYWPIAKWLFSGAFGITLFVVSAWTAWRYRRMPAWARVIALTCGLYWLWMCYGSKVPWDYVPFWRMTRFQYPLCFGLAVLFPCLLATARTRRALALGGMAIAVNAGLLLCGPHPGENARISRELAAYAAAHPHQRFITDYHTLNEIWAFSGLESPRNVATLNHAHWSQLADRNAARLAPAAAARLDAALINPLNLARTPEFAAFVDRYAGGPECSSNAHSLPNRSIIPRLRDILGSHFGPSGRVHRLRPGWAPAPFPVTTANHKTAQPHDSVFS